MLNSKNNNYEGLNKDSITVLDNEKSEDNKIKSFETETNTTCEKSYIKANLQNANEVPEESKDIKIISAETK